MDTDNIPCTVDTLCSRLHMASNLSILFKLKRFKLEYDNNMVYYIH